MNDKAKEALDEFIRLEYEKLEIIKKMIPKFYKDRNKNGKIPPRKTKQ